MFKVGFVSTPLHDENSIRGVGFYTKRLLAAMKDIGSKMDVEIIEILDHKSYILNQFDIVHYSYFDLFKHTLPIFKKTKTIVTIHDVIPLEFPNVYKPGLRGKLNLYLQGQALQNVEAVITDSYYSLKNIHKYLKVPHEKLKLAYLAADEIFKPKKVTKKYNLPKEFVLYVGDVNYNKNIPGLIEACKLSKLPLVMVGKQAAEIESMDLNHPELRHLIDHKSYIINHVIRLGFVSDEDLVDLYNLASVYCQPSYSEGFGLNPLEALACGTPVASSNRGSLPEVLGDNAIYFDPDNVSDIADAIKKSLTSKIIYPKSKFSWKQTAFQTLQIYNDILKS